MDQGLEGQIGSADIIVTVADACCSAIYLRPGVELGTPPTSRAVVVDYDAMAEDAEDAEDDDDEDDEDDDESESDRAEQLIDARLADGSLIQVY